METVPAAPGPPIMGVMAAGFVFLAVYVFARISSDGIGRYNACKRALVLCTIGMAIMVFLESLNAWRRILPPIEDPSIYPPVWMVPFFISIPFFSVILLDLAFQRVMLRN
ncbi:MAG: hypothetical protein ACXABN_13885 [Candidatus Thorarchaeota archaeon]|jgi:hypothetical protein